MGSIIFISIVLLFVILQIVAIRRMRGVWRWIACAPAAAIALIIAIIVIGVVNDPTSHNLWPLEIVMWSAGGIAFIGLLLGIKAIVKK